MYKIPQMWQCLYKRVIKNSLKVHVWSIYLWQYKYALQFKLYVDIIVSN